MLGQGCLLMKQKHRRRGCSVGDLAQGSFSFQLLNMCVHRHLHRLKAISCKNLFFHVSSPVKTQQTRVHPPRHCQQTKRSGARTLRA